MELHFPMLPLCYTSTLPDELSLRENSRFQFFWLEKNIRTTEAPLEESVNQPDGLLANTAQRAVTSRLICLPPEKAVDTILTTEPDSPGSPETHSEPKGIADTRGIPVAGKSGANHEEILSLLLLYKNQVITAKLEFIHSNFDDGFASFRPEENPLYCFKISFKCALQGKGIRFDILRRDYLIKGQLQFNNAKVRQYVTCQPATNFLQQKTQNRNKIPLKLDTNSIELINTKHNHNIFNDKSLNHLTAKQSFIYKTITSLYNELVTPAILNKRQHKNTIQGIARLFINNSEYFFITFKCLEKNINRNIADTLNSENCQIIGKLCYNYQWVISSIINNEPLIQDTSSEKHTFPSSLIEIFLRPETTYIKVID